MFSFTEEMVYIVEEGSSSLSRKDEIFSSNIFHCITVHSEYHPFLLQLSDFIFEITTEHVLSLHVTFNQLFYLTLTTLWHYGLSLCLASYRFNFKDNKKFSLVRINWNYWHITLTRRSNHWGISVYEWITLFQHRVNSSGLKSTISNTNLKLL